MAAFWAGRELDAYRAIDGDDKPKAFKLWTLRLIDKSGSSTWPKNDAKHGRALQLLRELNDLNRSDPVGESEPFSQLISTYLVYCEGRFEEAEAAFARLPAEMQSGEKREYESIFGCRVAGLYRRNLWREAYEKLAPRRRVFQALAHRMSADKKHSDMQALLDTHRKHYPNDPERVYHEVIFKSDTKKHSEAVALAEEFLDPKNREKMLKNGPPEYRTLLGFYSLDMRFRKAYSLVMLGRLDEAEGMLDSLIMTYPSRNEFLKVRVELLIALHKHDTEKVDQILSADPYWANGIYMEDDYATPFLSEPFAGLRQKHPRPTK